MPTPFTSAIRPQSFWKWAWNLIAGKKPQAIQDIGPDFAHYSRDELERLRQGYIELLGANERFVVYLNGTCVRLSADESLNNADEKLRRYGEVVFGTPSADFAVDHRADWHLVTCYHPDILVLVPRESLPTDNEALQGLLGRMCRHVDARHREVVGTNEDLHDR